ncbi:MAG TPA: tetratricopeptide repeat protein [Smithella sp.]|nr:tetratricopeptide repeat protein [Smithella sp.]HQG64432.1 tetratricopeptide repeat protein [Smithella sp.]
MTKSSVLHIKEAMFDRLNIDSKKQKLVVYIFLTVAALAVFGQVHQFDFINIDDDVYVTNNLNVQSGIHPEGIRWAFTTTCAEFWHPLTWLSLMLDYQLYGLNPGGYHITNLIFHILSTLLLFWLLNRMTGEIWKSAFVAALFTIHPLHVESVAWIAERKDVLSAFFWMLTLCLYVYYTEKPVITRYLPVLFSFACGLMSKPMLVTLPVMMILLDYWPLKRFQIKQGNLLLWQLREKAPLFVMSVVFSVIAIYAQYNPEAVHFSLGSRLATAFVSFTMYLEKIFWPLNVSFCYPLFDKLSLPQIAGSVLMTSVISILVIASAKRRPFLLVGWLWYAITLLPVLGIIHVRAERYAMADRYTYLPLIGIGIMIAWGVPFLLRRKDVMRKILFPAGLTVLLILSYLAWKQCGYWENSLTLINQTLRVTKDNYLAHYIRGITYFNLGQYRLAIRDFSKAIELDPAYEVAYLNRGVAYEKTGDFRKAIQDYDESIRLQPRFLAYYNKGVAHINLGEYQPAIEEFNKAIHLKADAYAYQNRGLAYLLQNNRKAACHDAQSACALGKCKLLEEAKSKGYCN